MEYLHRILQKLKNIPNFNFHSKCEKLSIINMSFADDLLLFAKGDIKFIFLVMEAFKDFSKSTGLSVNPNKCIYHCGNIDNQTKQEIHFLTNFSECHFPFMYLGIPLISKKLYVYHCPNLVEKIVAR